jgi:hypothetical protein
MARVPTPYDRDDEVPGEIFSIKRGSNNSRRATLRIHEYVSGELCLQVEDRVGGGEIWLNEDDFIDLVEGLTETLDALVERRHARGDRSGEDIS